MNWTCTFEDVVITREIVPDIDQECTALCKALNNLPSIRTVQSCCGHEEHPYRIWFVAESLEALPQLLYWFDACHCGFKGWSVVATTDCSMSPVKFVVEGPKGPQAYTEAEKIAGLIDRAEQ